MDQFNTLTNSSLQLDNDDTLTSLSLRQDDASSETLLTMGRADSYYEPHDPLEALYPRTGRTVAHEQREGRIRSSLETLSLVWDDNDSSKKRLRENPEYGMYASLTDSDQMGMIAYGQDIARVYSDSGQLDADPIALAGLMIETEQDEARKKQYRNELDRINNDPNGNKNSYYSLIGSMFRDGCIARNKKIKEMQDLAIREQEDLTVLAYDVITGQKTKDSLSAFAKTLKYISAPSEWLYAINEARDKFDFLQRLEARGCKSSADTFALLGDVDPQVMAILLPVLDRKAKEGRDNDSHFWRNLVSDGLARSMDNAFLAQAQLSAVQEMSGIPSVGSPSVLGLALASAQTTSFANSPAARTDWRKIYDERRRIAAWNSVYNQYVSSKHETGSDASWMVKALNFLGRTTGESLPWLIPSIGAGVGFSSALGDNLSMAYAQGGNLEETLLNTVAQAVPEMTFGIGSVFAKGTGVLGKTINKWLSPQEAEALVAGLAKPTQFKNVVQHALAKSPTAQFTVGALAGAAEEIVTENVAQTAIEWAGSRAMQLYGASIDPRDFAPFKMIAEAWGDDGAQGAATMLFCAGMQSLGARGIFRRVKNYQTICDQARASGISEKSVAQYMDQVEKGNIEKANEVLDNAFSLEVIHDPEGALGRVKQYKNYLLTQAEAEAARITRAADVFMQLNDLGSIRQLDNDKYEVSYRGNSTTMNAAQADAFIQASFKNYNVQNVHFIQSRIVGESIARAVNKEGENNYMVTASLSELGDIVREDLRQHGGLSMAGLQAIAKNADEVARILDGVSAGALRGLASSMNERINFAEKRGEISKEIASEMRSGKVGMTNVFRVGTKNNVRDSIILYAQGRARAEQIAEDVQESFLSAYLADNSPERKAELWSALKDLDARIFNGELGTHGIEAPTNLQLKEAFSRLSLSELLTSVENLNVEESAKGVARIAMQGLIATQALTDMGQAWKAFKKSDEGKSWIEKNGGENNALLEALREAGLTVSHLLTNVDFSSEDADAVLSAMKEEKANAKNAEEKVQAENERLYKEREELQAKKAAAKDAKEASQIERDLKEVNRLLMHNNGFDPSVVGEVDWTVRDKDGAADVEAMAQSVNDVVLNGDETDMSSSLEFNSYTELNNERKKIKDDAIKDGTFLKAPNGKASNLTENLWITVRTSSFKGWFGDWLNDPSNASKVVDANGEPFVVYHGSNSAGFTVFEKTRSRAKGTKKGSLHYHWFFFSADRRVSATYASGVSEEIILTEKTPTGGKDRKGVYAVFLNIRNPRVLDFNGKRWKHRGYIIKQANKMIDLPNKRVSFETKSEAMEYAKKHEIKDVSIEEQEIRTDDFVIETLRNNKELKNPHDGLIIVNVQDSKNREKDPTATDCIVFKSSQIKSATQNQGSFDGGNSDITASVQVTRDELYRMGSIVADVRDEMGAIEEVAKNAGTWLKAPNGADTNLTPARWSLFRTAGYKEWFGDWMNDPANASKVVDANGEPFVVYHGTGRADRVGTVFLPERATSGPMAFFTDAEDVAEGYAKNKADTSLAYEEDSSDYKEQFRVKLPYFDIPIHKYWGYLSFKDRARIEKTAKHITEDEDGNIVVDNEYNDVSLQDFIKRARGNVLYALEERWLNSGTLFGREEDFMEVLKKLELPTEPYFKDPNYREEKVYACCLRIVHPFRTADITRETVDALKKASQRVKEKPESRDADSWDKNSISPEEWVERLERDYEDGTTHAWTSIPDWVTDWLKKNGYDGIIDQGGKYHEQKHMVYIPFSSTQIKSATDNRGTFDADDADITASITIPQERICRTKEEARAMVGRKGEPIHLENKFLELKASFSKMSERKFAHDDSRKRTEDNLIAEGFTEKEANTLHWTAYGNIVDLFANAERMKIEKAYKKTESRKGFLHVYSPFEVKGSQDEFVADIELMLLREKGALPIAYILNVGVEKRSQLIPSIPAAKSSPEGNKPLFVATEEIKQDFPEIVKQEDSFSSSIADTSMYWVEQDLEAARNEHVRAMRKRIETQMKRINVLSSEWGNPSKRVNESESLSAFATAVELVSEINRTLPAGYRFDTRGLLTQAFAMLKVLRRGQASLSKLTKAGEEAVRREIREEWKKMNGGVRGERVDTALGNALLREVMETNTPMTPEAKKAITARVAREALENGTGEVREKFAKDAQAIEDMMANARVDFGNVLRKLIEKTIANMDRYEKSLIRRSAEKEFACIPYRKKPSGKLATGKTNVSDYERARKLQLKLGATAEEKAEAMDGLRTQIAEAEAKGEEARADELTRELYDWVTYGNFSGMSVEQAHAMLDDLKQFIGGARNAWDRKKNNERLARKRIAEKLAEGLGRVTREDIIDAERKDSGSLPKKALQGIVMPTLNFTQFLSVMGKEKSLAKVIKRWRSELARINIELQKREQKRATAFTDMVTKTLIEHGADKKEKMDTLVSQWIVSTKKSHRTNIRLKPFVLHQKTFTINEAKALLADNAQNVIPKLEVWNLGRRVAEEETKGATGTDLFDFVWREQEEQPPITLTKASAMNIILLYEQKDYATNFILDGWGEEQISQLYDFVGARDLAIAYGLRELIAENGKELAQFFEEREGIPFPAVENYFPAFFPDANKVQDAKMPGEATPAGSAKTTFLMPRVKNQQKIPLNVDALNLFWGSQKEVDNYLLTADFVKELRGIFSHDAVRDAIKVKFSPSQLRQLQDWLTVMERAGSFQLSIARHQNAFIRAFTSAAAVAMLSYNALTHLKQVTAVLHGMYSEETEKMRFISMFFRMAGKEGREAVKHIMSSDALRVRIKDYKNIEFLLTAETDSNWNKIDKFSQAGMDSLEKLDAWSNAYSMAVLYRARQEEMREWNEKNPDTAYTEEEIESESMAAVERALEFTAMPQTQTQKSAFSQRQGAFVNVLTFMGGEAVNKLGAMVSLCAQGKVADAIAIYGTIALSETAISYIYNSLILGDDDDKDWEYIAKKYSLGILSPFTGLPVLGTAIEGVGSAFMGQRVYAGTSPQQFFDMTGLIYAIKRIYNDDASGRTWESLTRYLAMILGAGQGSRSEAIDYIARLALLLGGVRNIAHPIIRYEENRGE